MIPAVFHRLLRRPLVVILLLLFASFATTGFRFAVGEPDTGDPSTTAAVQSASGDEVSPSIGETTNPSVIISSTIVEPTPAGESGITTLFDPLGEGAPAVDANAYVLYDAETGTFLLGKSPDTPLPPASITKVMTVLLAFEKLDMQETITVTREMYESIPEDYVRIGLVEGEEITVEEAISASIVKSANDAAMALAIYMGGTVEGFSEMMNARAVELGCNATNFTNPYGFADPLHVTSAHDMALIMAEAIKHESYQKISMLASYTMPPTNKRLEPLTLKNGNKFISTSTYTYDKYIGGKTGFTDLSGHTITAVAQSNHRTLVAVILGASSSNVRYENLISLFDYGFATYSSVMIRPEDYSSMQTGVANQITSSISAAGYELCITELNLSVIPYLTIRSERLAGGYTDTIDISTAVIQANESVQVLALPLLRTFSDGSKETLGTLSVTICTDEAAATHQAVAESKPLTMEEIGIIVFRVGIILILTAVLFFVIFLFIKFQRARNHRRHRAKPKVL